MVSALAESHDDFYDPDLVESTSDDYNLEFDDYNSDGYEYEGGGEDYSGEMPDDLDLEVGGGGDSDDSGAPSYQLDPTGKYYVDQYGNYYDLDWNPVSPPGTGTEPEQDPETGTSPGTGTTEAPETPSPQDSTDNPSDGSAEDASSGGTDTSSSDGSDGSNEITIIDPTTGKTYTDPVDDTAQDNSSASDSEQGQTTTPTTTGGSSGAVPSSTPGTSGGTSSGASTGTGQSVPTAGTAAGTAGAGTSTGGTSQGNTGNLDKTEDPNVPDELSKPGDTNQDTDTVTVDKDPDYTQIPPPISLFPELRELLKRRTTLNNGELPYGYSEADGFNGTNEQLIAMQNIISGLTISYDDFRFYTVKKEPAFAKAPVSILEEMAEDAREIGTLGENGTVYVLSEENNGWLYVESGNVRGFVRADQFLSGQDADGILTDLENSIPGYTDMTADEQEESLEGLLTFANETVPASESLSFSYRRCTTKSTVIDKSYAVADSDTAILERAENGARQIGTLSPGSLCYVILQANDEWIYVESGNVRGFVPSTSLTTGEAAKDIVQKQGEANMPTAKENVVPKDNEALYYSLNSVREGSSLSSVRTEVLRSASQYIGGPYVWGGNSLTDGCDCSGFVQQLYAQFGYSLPRTAADQSVFGIQIPVSDAVPGDLIFFASNGVVYHVAVYAGDGTTIEAYSPERGIIAASIANRDAVWATRVITD